VISNKQLFQWGGWVRAGKNPIELGYPRKSVLYMKMMLGIRLAPLDYTTWIRPLTYLDYEQMDAAINQLSIDDRQILIWRYVRLEKIRHIACMMGLSRPTIYARMERIQRDIDKIIH
jgi:DNA invertase Pin-like site-specific DNA recombinase